MKSLTKKEPAKVTVPHRDKQLDWYCVKTTYHHDGKIESEIMVDENTNLPIAIECPDKPLDGYCEMANATIYYSYHYGYKAAARQVAAVEVHSQIQQTISMVSYTSFLLSLFFA
ncbi:MAG: hypothetical protein IJ741_06975 [Schwartzia sp.]|nr:hypothetical protein [Schwartzia sp. (in: firmicutes)]